MKTVVREAGRAPAIATFGSMNARNGAKVLADMLAPQEWADLAVITIDYTGDGFTSALVLLIVKWFPEYKGKYVHVDWTLDLNDAFGLDNFSGAVARDIVQGLKETLEEKVQAGPPSGG